MCDVYDIKLLSPSSDNKQTTLETNRCFITSDHIKVDYDEMPLDDILITTENTGGIYGNITDINKTVKENKNSYTLYYEFKCENTPITIVIIIPTLDKNRSVFVHDTIQCGDKYNKFEVVNSDNSTSINFYQDDSIRASILFNLMFVAKVDFHMHINMHFECITTTMEMNRC